MIKVEGATWKWEKYSVILQVQSIVVNEMYHKKKNSRTFKCIV